MVCCCKIAANIIAARMSRMRERGKLYGTVTPHSVVPDELYGPVGRLQDDALTLVAREAVNDALLVAAPNWLPGLFLLFCLSSSLMNVI